MLKMKRRRQQVRRLAVKVALSLLAKGNLRGARLLLWAISPAAKARHQELVNRRKRLKAQLLREQKSREKNRLQPVRLQLGPRRLRPPEE